MYSVFDYGSMLSDPRAGLYAEALRRTLKPGAVVVDLGAGTGVWAAYACSLGARRVFAIEPDDVIGLAIETAKANGLDDRITFIQCDSTHATLDEPADVVVADLRGILPFGATGLAAMIDARRFLKPGGVLIPKRDTLWVSVVEAPTAHQVTVAPWDVHCFGLDVSAARRAAVSMWRKERFEPRDLIASAAVWAELDYRTLRDPSASGAARLVAQRDGMAHGLAVWFESELTDGVRLSNRPGDPPLIYGHGFFPWPSAVEVSAGDTIDVGVRATFSGLAYIFNWDSVIADAGSGAARAHFSQSTFDSAPLALATVHGRAAEAVVTPGPHGETERFVLNAFDGATPQGEIADALMRRFPGRFASHADALARVAAIGVRLVKDGAQVDFRD